MDGFKETRKIDTLSANRAIQAKYTSGKELNLSAFDASNMKTLIKQAADAEIGKGKIPTLVSNVKPTVPLADLLEVKKIDFILVAEINFK